MTKLDEMMLPEDVVCLLKSKGLEISERYLRKYAREHGICCILGKSMFFLPHHIDALLEASECTPSPKEAKSGGIHSLLKANESDDLLKRLTRKKRQKSPQKNSGGTVVSLSTAQNL